MDGVQLPQGRRATTMKAVYSWVARKSVLLVEHVGHRWKILQKIYFV